MEWKEALRFINRYHPCPHENWEPLGYGTVWVKCDDCGETISKDRLEAYKQNSDRFDEAISLLEDLLTKGK